MKKLILITFFLLLHVWCIAQNLVPNWSFEDYSICPTATSQINRATGWSININTADYYNACAIYSSMVSVPNTGVGYQCPATGSAYAGFHAFKGASPQLWQYREYFGGALLNPLIIGQKYYIRLKISLADASYCAVNKIGVKFVNINYGDTSLGPVCPLTNNYAHFYTDSIIADTTKWVTITGSFIADSAYQYLLIGNFFDNINTDTSIITGNLCYNSYYFVDDVCVSIDTLTCVIPDGLNICDTGVNIFLEKFSNDIFIIYPNPSNGHIIIDQQELINTKIRIYKLTGKLLFEKIFFQKEILLDLSLYDDGLYIIQILQNNKIYYYKCVLIKD